MKFLPEVRFSKNFLNTLNKIEKQIKGNELTKEIKEEYIKVTRKGIVDKLTGLYNRRKFDEDIENLFEQVDVKKKIHLSMLIIDIDNFKLINDQFGHDKGDSVLRWIAKTIKNSLRDRPGFRESVRFYRYGGEEFAVLLAATNPQISYIVAERIRRTIANDTNNNISVSIGTANTADKKCLTIDDLIKCADLALYKAKNTGKNKIIINELNGKKIE